MYNYVIQRKNITVNRNVLLIGYHKTISMNPSQNAHQITTKFYWKNVKHLKIKKYDLNVIALWLKNFHELWANLRSFGRIFDRFSKLNTAHVWFFENFFRFSNLRL